MTYEDSPFGDQLSIWGFELPSPCPAMSLCTKNTQNYTNNRSVGLLMTVYHKCRTK